MSRNEDLFREAVEGPRLREDGSKLPTPYYCCQCRVDACYGYGGSWYCTSHWVGLASGLYKSQRIAT